MNEMCPVTGHNFATRPGDALPNEAPSVDTLSVDTQSADTPSVAMLPSDALRRDEVFRRLADRIAKAKPIGPVNLVGPDDAQKSLIALALAKAAGRRPCLLVADELRARAMADDLRAWQSDPVYVFRPREFSFTDAEAASYEEERQRLAMLAAWLDGSPGCWVIPASACLQKLPPVAYFRANRLRLTVGQTIEPEDLQVELIRIGYERVRLCEGAGQFAVRGDLVDVIPVAADERVGLPGIRISFFDREIDSIKQFDSESQRSEKNLTLCSFPPAREALVDPARRTPLAEAVAQAGEQAVLDLLRQGGKAEQADAWRRLTRQDAARIEASLHFPTLDRWLPLIFPRAAGVLDYTAASGALLFVDEPLRVRNRLDGAQADFEERIRSLLAKGQVTPVVAEACWRGVDIGRHIDRQPAVIALCQIASSGNGLPGGQTLTIQGRAQDSFRGRENVLWQEVCGTLDNRGTVRIFAGSAARAERLRQVAAEYDVPVAEGSVHRAAGDAQGAIGNRSVAEIRAENLSRGFVWPAAGLSVIGTHDLFGSERQTRRRRQAAGLHIDLFSDLTAGEWVVHDAHGIGRYEGLTNLSSGGVRRDYLKIAYAGDDTLFIPIESLDQIQKYIGSDGREPRLSKLGGQEWNRMKERARDSIRKLATDLVALYARRQSLRGHAFAPDTVWQQEFEERFPYEETEDQLRCIAEIKSDMESDRVMDRLLCGDVGFGKTEVAFRALFKCVMDGRQALLLAPTTVLAQQHFDNLQARLADFPVTVGLLSRFATPAMQKTTIAGVVSGRVDIAVGTHRLLSRDVKPRNLGLLIVDEEQRFGVDHKETIKAQWPTVDVLTLTATPIPRTLHMAMSGIRDISVIEEAPHDRRPVQTYVMDYDEAILAEAILREISRRGQVFYLFNDTHRIDEKSAALERQLPGVRILTAHAKMSERLLEEIVAAFIRQEADVLVCTTIIESGIDMPNVNTIIVENADHLGLAQLYQLRGRVGRSDRQAFAYVTYRRDKVLTEVAEKRLATIRDFTELGSGFKIALRDLEVRGAGNLLGAEQHGHLEAIGYDLYCRMLDEEIKQARGEIERPRVKATVDLDVDAFIPRSHIADEGLRMDLYRRLAAIASAADYRDVLDEWIDRFGEPPETALTLADIAYIRSSAERHGFSRVQQHQQNVVISYAAGERPDMRLVSGLLGQPDFRGRILFDAGTQPHLVYRQAAADRRTTSEKLRKLFLSLESGEGGPIRG